MENLLAILTEMLLVALNMLNHDAQTALCELWLLLATTTCCLIAALDRVAKAKCLVEASLVVFGAHKLSNLSLLRFLVKQDLRAVEAHTSKHLADVLNETSMVYWALKHDVPEVARALTLVYQSIIV